MDKPCTITSCLKGYDLVNCACVKSPPCNDFLNRIKDILKHKGGYVNNINDPGGATNKGITWAVWKENSSSMLNITPTLDNLKNLSDSQAGILYKELYWNSISADAINDGDLRYIIFDFNVNAGGNAIKVLQKTLNNLGSNLTVDGAMGTQTINALNNANPVILYNSYKENRQAYYNRLAAKSDKMATFLSGWTDRVNKFKNKTNENKLNVNCK